MIPGQTCATCRHCQAKKANRPRGLCWHCYYAPGVRDLYPAHPLGRHLLGEAGAARKREIVRLRGEGLTLEQIAARFGITRERVRQILGEAPQA